MSTDNHSRTILTVAAILLGLIFAGTAAGAQTATTDSWVMVEETSSVVELTYEIKPVETGEESSAQEGQAPATDYPQGDQYQLWFKNETTEDFQRLISFSYPHLANSSPWTPATRSPHVTDFQILSGDASLEVLPLPGAQVYGFLQLSIPAGEEVQLTFAHEGPIKGVGIYLWQAKTFSEYRDYQTWSGGAFLGIVSVLLAFGVGGALISWSRQAAAILLFLAAAWLLEFVTLTGGPWSVTPLEDPGPWRPIALALLGLAAVGLLWAHMDIQRLAKRFRQLFLGAGLTFAAIILFASFGLNLSIVFARAGLLVIWLATLILLLTINRPLALINNSIIAGLWAMLTTGLVAALGPVIDWGVSGLIIEPLLHGAFMVSLGLLVFPSTLAQQIVSQQPALAPSKPIERRETREVRNDQLTRLATRQALIGRLSRELQQSEHHPRACPALLVIDLDRFKSVNDGLGHGQGDLLLQTMARRIETVIGPGDMVARIGSDEFAIMLAHGTSETSDEEVQNPEGPKAEELADYLLDLLSQPLDLGGREIFPTASIGVAHGQDWHEEADDLLKDAEIAMYKAKRDGGARYVVYDPHMRGDSGEALALETDLRRALQRGQIELLYQPIMDLNDGRIAGFESLIRWRHPDHGLLVPDQFVALAEETDMIIPLGRFTLSMASLQLAQWQRFFPLRQPLFVSVNISSRQLIREDFAADLAEVLQSAQLQPHTLKLEVTESQILENPDLAEAHLIDAQELGAGVALDDFGTGFSSLSNLQRYPFDTIKVDRSFVSTLESRTDSPVIVNSIIELARDLDLTVIAEGLETNEDVSLLRQMGCRYGQGYVFGEPMSSADAQAFIAHHWKNEP